LKWAGTQYHAPDEAAVRATLRAYGFLTAPILPPPHVLREFHRHIAAASKSAVLIFGATPELVDMANELGVPRIVSMDWNVDNFEAMRRIARTDWTRVEFRHGDWTVPADELAEDFGCVCCDGGPLFLRFPDQWRAMSLAAFGYLRGGGTWVSRAIDWPADDPPFEICVRRCIDAFIAERPRLTAEAALAAFKAMTVHIRVRSFHRVVGTDYAIDQALLARRNDEAARLLFERFPEAPFLEIADMNLLRLARPVPDRSDLVSIVPPEPARRVLDELGFDTEVVDLKATPPGCDYVLAATKR